MTRTKEKKNWRYQVGSEEGRKKKKKKKERVRRISGRNYSKEIATPSKIRQDYNNQSKKKKKPEERKGGVGYLK